MGVNAFASISQTTFTSNVFNRILIFYNNPKFPTNQYEKLISKSSIFKHGLSPCSLEFASGLSMMFTQTTYTVVVTISNVTTYNNKRDCVSGTGNIMFILDKCSYHCTLVRAYSVNSTEAFGDGMSMEFRNIIRAIQYCNQRCNTISTFHSKIHVFQSWFSNNTGHGIVIYNNQKTTIKVQIKSTTFNYNNNDGLYCSNINNIELIDTNFIQNNLTAIFAGKTQLHFRGNTTLALNTVYWGAVRLI